MKYIRTKDGRIIDTSDWEAHYSKKGDEYVLESYTANFNVLMGVLAEDIIAEADTIEELCDCFAIEDTFTSEMFWFGPSFFGSKPLARTYAVDEKRKVFGYIVIEKNGVKTLEPVLQTNEKGEFELP